MKHLRAKNAIPPKMLAEFNARQFAISKAASQSEIILDQVFVIIFFPKKVWKYSFFQENLTVEELERRVEHLKSKNMNYKKVLRRLVSMYAENGDHVKLIKAIEELDSIGAEVSNSALRAVLFAATSFDNAEDGENLGAAENVL